MTEQPPSPSSSIRSPLGRARGLGSAHDGTHHWILQRVSAVALIPLALFFLSQLPEITSADYTAFRDWIRQPLTAIALLLFIICSFYHGSLGLQVIIEDYVSNAGRKFALLLLNKLTFLFLGFACLYAVIAINFALHG